MLNAFGGNVVIGGVTPTNALLTLIGAIRSGDIIIADDKVGQITTPQQGGFVLITASPDVPSPYNDMYALVHYDTGITPALRTLVIGSRVNNNGNTNLTGTTGDDLDLNISAQFGVLQFENRLGANADFAYLWLI